MSKEPRIQPATKEKACQVCGISYVYPELNSQATRFHCELCAGLSPLHRRVMGRMAKRIQSLERKLK
ncbi:MAG: hypothetical protein ACO3ZW_03175 [Opitutales bacterium]|jgi:hypothetical protein